MLAGSNNMMYAHQISDGSRNYIMDFDIACGFNLIPGTEKDKDESRSTVVLLM